MKLFGHPDSGHAFKVRFFLADQDIKHEYEFVDIFSNREDRQRQFQENARYGEVPLLIHDGQALVQSNAILLHLARFFQVSLGSKPSTERQCVEWLMWEANKIGMCLPQLRSFKRFGMDTGQENAKQWLIDRYRHDVGVIEQTLSDGRQWIVADNGPTIADYSLCGYLVFADEAEVDIPQRTTEWLERLFARKGYQHPYQLLSGSHA